MDTKDVKVPAEKINELLEWAQASCEDPGEAIAVLTTAIIIIAIDNVVEPITLEDLTTTFTDNWHYMHAQIERHEGRTH